MSCAPSSPPYAWPGAGVGIPTSRKVWGNCMSRVPVPHLWSGTGSTLLLVCGSQHGALGREASWSATMKDLEVPGLPGEGMARCQGGCGPKKVCGQNGDAPGARQGPESNVWHHGPQKVKWPDTKPMPEQDQSGDCSREQGPNPSP